MNRKLLAGLIVFGVLLFVVIGAGLVWKHSSGKAERDEGSCPSSKKPPESSQPAEKQENKKPTADDPKKPDERSATKPCCRKKKN